MGCVKWKKCLEHAQNAQIQIILLTLKVSCWPLLSIHTFSSSQGVCYGPDQTVQMCKLIWALRVSKKDMFSHGAAHVILITTSKTCTDRYLAQVKDVLVERWEKGDYDLCKQWRCRSAHAWAQSHLGLPCSSMHFTVSNNSVGAQLKTLIWLPRCTDYCLATT